MSADTKTVGVIGGLGPAATLDFFDRILKRTKALRDQDHLRLIIDNNTKDPAIWQPVRTFCENLGPSFRFFHLEPWPGYKAGALNFAIWRLNS